MLFLYVLVADAGSSEAGCGDADYSEAVYGSGDLFLCADF